MKTPPDPPLPQPPADISPAAGIAPPFLWQLTTNGALPLRDLAKRSLIPRIVAGDAEALQQAPTPETDAYIGEDNDDNMTEGEIALCEFARRLERRLAAALAVIEAIEDRYIDGCDTYADWKFMGDTARESLRHMQGIIDETVDLTLCCEHRLVLPLIFMLTDTEIIEAVRELNAEIYDKLAEEYIAFEAAFNGTSAVVMFMGNRIWFADEDSRTYDEETDTYEPLIDYLRRIAVEEIAKITEFGILWSNAERRHTEGAKNL